MARGGIRIPFVADVRDFLRGTRKISDDLDGMQRDLADTARDSGRTAERVEQDWEQAGRESAAAFDRFARDADQAFERVERSARESARTADRALSTGVSGTGLKASLGILAGEAFQEFTQSWGEAIRGGDPAEAIRELFSNLALVGGAAFGPVGAVAGGVAGFFLTGLYDKLTDAEAKAQLDGAVAQLFDTVTGDAELSGAEAAQAYWRGFLDESDIGNQLQQALGTENVAQAYAEIDRLVRQTGLSVDTVTGAVLGQRDAVELVVDAEGRVQVAIDQTLTRQGEVFDRDRERSNQLGEQVDIYGDQLGAVRELLGIGQTQNEANSEGLRLDRVRRDVLASQTDELAGGAEQSSYLRDRLNSTVPPNLAPLASSLSAGAESARLVEERLNRISGREVSVTIRERLIRTAQLEAQLGGSLAGNQEGLDP